MADHLTLAPRTFTRSDAALEAERLPETDTSAQQYDV
jgi:hypothetical protein